MLCSLLGSKLQYVCTKLFAHLIQSGREFQEEQVVVQEPTEHEDGGIVAAQLSATPAH